ncbi:hypothetical protein [Saccharibacillus kuerlensis]|uniref:Uncharacterized protein n=1 Tax=Saccharibacillus kuerlensis TaxID=459527 RepID=A0ABQ2L3U7_9BACL|nr:hypothetical protein [Saccharibacillus kuerlensis]GGN99736.1 hypothetical protein GCM10010969_20120 [Saccharibacillus kuerlensis]
MLESRIVSGKVIEQRGHIVITVQGGLVSSYDLRYYKLPEEDVEELLGFDGNAAELRSSASPVVLSNWKRHAFSPPSEQENEKSAYRA